MIGNVFAVYTFFLNFLSTLFPDVLLCQCLLLIRPSCLQQQKSFSIFPDNSFHVEFLHVYSEYFFSRKITQQTISEIFQDCKTHFYYFDNNCTKKHKMLMNMRYRTFKLPMKRFCCFILSIALNLFPPHWCILLIYKLPLFYNFLVFMIFSKFK